MRSFALARRSSDPSMRHAGAASTVLAAALILGCGSSSTPTTADAGRTPGAEGGGKPTHDGGTSGAHDGGSPNHHDARTGVKDASHETTTETDAGHGGTTSGIADTGTTMTDSGAADGKRDTGIDAGPPPLSDASFCGAASGTVAWQRAIVPTGSSLNLSDLAVGPTDDVLVADNSAGTSFEIHRWDKSGNFLSTHVDALGSYSAMTTSNLFVDSSNGAFYGMLLSGMASGTNRQADLVFSKIAANGTAVFANGSTQTMPTSAGTPDVVLFNAGGDMGGGLHGAFLATGPQYFSPAVYCWGATGSDVGPSAGTVTATLNAHDFEWPTPGEGLALSMPVTETTSLGCSTTPTVPSTGGLILAGLDAGGSCQWNKLLALPTASIVDYDFRVGDDGSLDFAVVFTGTINFGNEALTATHSQSSLAVARFDSAGTLSWAVAFGGMGAASDDAAFTLGDLRVNSNGDTVVSAGYSGTVAIGTTMLPSTDNTVVTVLTSAAGAVKWAKTMTVDAPGVLATTIGTCGVIVATNSPSVNLGAGALSSKGSGTVASIGVAALGL
jgi:hypothetical protein